MSFFRTIKNRLCGDSGVDDDGYFSRDLDSVNHEVRTRLTPAMFSNEEVVFSDEDCAMCRRQNTSANFDTDNRGACQSPLSSLPHYSLVFSDNEGCYVPGAPPMPSTATLPSQQSIIDVIYPPTNKPRNNLDLRHLGEFASAPISDVRMSGDNHIVRSNQEFQQSNSTSPMILESRRNSLRGLGLDIFSMQSEAEQDARSPTLPEVSIGSSLAVDEIMQSVDDAITLEEASTDTAEEREQTRFMNGVLDELGLLRQGSANFEEQVSDRPVSGGSDEMFQVRASSESPIIGVPRHPSLRYMNRVPSRRPARFGPTFNHVFRPGPFAFPNTMRTRHIEPVHRHPDACDVEPPPPYTRYDITGGMNVLQTARPVDQLPHFQYAPYDLRSEFA